MVDNPRGYQPLRWWLSSTLKGATYYKHYIGTSPETGIETMADNSEVMNRLREARGPRSRGGIVLRPRRGVLAFNHSDSDTNHCISNRAVATMVAVNRHFMVNFDYK